MTFSSSDDRNYPGKSNEMHQDLPSFFGTTSYTFYYDQFINKTQVEGLQNSLLISLLLTIQRSLSKESW